MHRNVGFYMAVVVFLSLPGATPSRGGEVPSIQELQRAYRAAYDRQVAATRALTVEFRLEGRTLPLPPKPGTKVDAEKTEKERETAQLLERRIEANNRLSNWDVTYYRTGEHQRLDEKTVNPDDRREENRSVVIADGESFGVTKPPGSGEYVLDFFERSSEQAARRIGRTLGFVNAARHVAFHEVSDYLLGDEFRIDKIRVEPGPDVSGGPPDYVIAEVRRIKPPKPSRIPRHVVRATLTLDPRFDYRLVRHEMELDDGYVEDGAIEYGTATGPAAFIPTKLTLDLHKDGQTHRRVETSTLKGISFDEPPAEVFTKEAFGLDTGKPSEARLTPLILAGLGLALVALGVVMYTRRARPRVAGNG